MIPRLGVNIDHVATLRQARGEDYPSIVDAATTCFNEGADQITIHLREDRRHIQDTDLEAVHLVTKKYGKPLNLEMGCNDEIIEIAITASPDWVCLVPEKREELTTEGGLNILDPSIFEKVETTCKRLRANVKGIQISFFIEANKEVLEKAALLKPDAVEIHTGDYARIFQNGDDYSHLITQYREAYDYLKSNNIGCHAGHGLTFESTVPLLKEKIFTEFNIGHWIICQSVFDGLSKVVSKLKKLFDSYSLG